MSMEEIQCSKEIIISFINKIFFCEYTKFQDIPGHFQENVEIPRVSSYFQDKS